VPSSIEKFNTLVSAGAVLVLAFMIVLRLVALARRKLAPASSAQPGEELERALLSLVSTAATIGVGIVWTALIYTGQSFTVLSQGQGSVLNWAGVLVYTWIWLSMLSSPPAQDRAGLRGQIVVRTLFYGVCFALAIITLNQW
jgi:hypothetical protein